jgi:hypothetical protein
MAGERDRLHLCRGEAHRRSSLRQCAGGDALTADDA